MQLSVIIPTFRRPELLKRCLQALTHQTLDPAAYEILVVDDGNDISTRVQVLSIAAHTNVRIRYYGQPQRRGPAAARNRGWQQARSPYVAFTDDDCIPDSNWLNVLLDAFAQGAQVITGRVVVPLSEAPTDYDRTTALLETAEFVTANCACIRSLLEQVGGLEEQFDRAWREDSDLQFKFIQHGIPIVKSNQAVIIHPIRSAKWWGCLKDESKNRYDALLYKRHPQLFRERIPTYAPLVRLYYTLVVSFLLGLGSGLAGAGTVSTVAFAIWALGTLILVGWRLRNTAQPLRHLPTTLVSALATPFLSIYWRLYGAVQYRVLYA